MPTLGDLSPQGSIALGILVGLLSTSIQSIGLTLQRKSHILEDEKDPSEYRRPPFKRRRWQLGMLMFLVSNLVGSTVQLTTLPLPVLSTLQAAGLAFNSICASLILGEPFTRWSFGGTVLVCIGAVLIAIFGAIGEPAHNLNQLLDLLRRRQFIIWMVCTGIVVIAIIALAKLSKYLRPWAKHHPRMRFFRGMTYGAVSGILSAHTLLVAKSAVELVVRTIAGENQFTRWEFWVIILGLVGFGVSQLFYMHRGLKLCSTSVLYPFMFCVYNIVAIIDGLIYFNQLDRLSLPHSLLVSYIPSLLPAPKADSKKIALGTVILLLGVFALSWRLNSDPISRQPVSQNPLTPGLGMIDDERTDTDGTVTPNGDEESALLDDKESPLPNREPRTPTSTNNHILNITRLRRKGLTESEEIWRELEDESPSPLTPFHPYRRSSLRSTSSPSTKLNSRFDLPDLDEDDPSERSGLLTRSGTGRTYRTLHHGKRRSTPGSEARRRRSASSTSQAALGGWWKMNWWKDGKGEKAKSKGKGKESDGARGNDGRGDEERGEGGSNI